MTVHDLAIIGGGIAGLGIFECAARAGLKAVLVDRGAPGRETTAVTSGLLHGGLRYLPYDVGTSWLMCREIERLRAERPELLTRQEFVWPVYRGDGLGLRLVEALHDEYDLFARLRGARRHERLSPAGAAARLPGLRADSLLGAVSFDEWRVDVPGLVAALARSAVAAGGELQEGRRVVGLTVRGGRVASAAIDGGRGEIAARVFVNAAGPWAEEVARLAGASTVRLRLRKGVHLVIPGDPPPRGLIFPGPGGRRVGAYPRPGETWVGPTDVPHDGPPDEARVRAPEQEDLRRALALVLPGLAARPCRAVMGLRPIPHRSGAAFLLSREHRIFDHAGEGLSNLVTVAGGKLTTYRPMGEDVLAAVLEKLGRPPAAPAPVEAERGMPWPLIRAGGLAASAALLSGFVLRRAFTGRR
ncbi:MAG: FAD-dependent oxidoreductase [Elusimicrobia bacterium]|nr:FAD-dependent oxidoreductase [Elusimicrobiota bacterium]